MATIDEQIAANNAKIEANTLKISQLKTAEAQWRSQSLVPCEQALPSKRNACIADKQWKAAQAKSCKDQASALTAMNIQLKADNTALIAQREAEADATRELAKQGKTPASIQAEASAKAEAAKIVAQGQAQAVVKTAEATAETEAKTKQIVYVTAALLLLAIIAVVIMRKLKKKK